MKKIWATPALDDLTPREWKRLLLHLSENGFHGIEPLISGPYELKKETIRELINESGVMITGVRTGAITAKHSVTFSHPEQKVRAEAVIRFKEIVHYVAEFGNPRLLVGLMQGRLQPAQSLTDAEDNIIECIRDCADEARQYEMEIDIEPVNRYELGYHSKAEEVIEFIRLINRPNVRILLDTFHMNIEEASIESALIKTAPFLGHLHISDSNRLIPGKGHFNFRGFFKALRGLVYDGDVAVEADIHNLYDDIRNTAIYLNNIIF